MNDSYASYQKVSVPLRGNGAKGWEGLGQYSDYVMGFRPLAG